MLRSISEPQLESLVFLLCIPLDGVTPLHSWNSSVTVELYNSCSNDSDLQRVFLGEPNR